MSEPPVGREAAARFRATAKHRLAWTAALLLGPTVGYFALFSWDHERKYPYGETSGPYGTWQIALLLAILLPLVVTAARRSMPVLATVLISTTLTFWFAQDWAQTDDSGLYAVGVIMLAVGSLVGVGFVAALARSWQRSNPRPGNGAEPRA